VGIPVLLLISIQAEDGSVSRLIAARHHIGWRSVILLGTAVLLVTLELGHPLLDDMHTISMLTPVVVLWLVFHLLLVPLFALMG